MIEVSEKLKKAFMSDNVEKHVRITFPNGEHDEITNENIVANTLQFTESLCSEQTLKFGLCEANVFRVTAECGNIKGCIISVFIDVFYDGEVFEMPLGMFKVDSCKRQAGTHLRNIEAYTEIIENTYKINEIEKAKRSLGVRTNTPYNVDLFKTLVNSGIVDPKRFISSKTICEPRIGVGSRLFIKNALVEKTSTSTSNIYIAISPEHKYARMFKDDVEDIYDVTVERNKEYDIEQNADDITNRGLSLIEEMKTDMKITVDLISYDELYANVLELLKNLDNKKESIKITEYSSKEGWESLSQEIPATQYYYPYMGNLKYAENTSDMNEHDLYTEFHLPTDKFRLEVTYLRSSTSGAMPYSKTIVDSVKLNIDDAYIEKCVLDDFFNVNLSIDRVSSTTSRGELIYIVPPNDIETNFLESFCEINGLFGKTSRTMTLELIGINKNFALYPQDEIFPNGEIYPVYGTNYMPLSTTSYKAADYEEWETIKYGYVRVSYLASDNEKYSITVECDSRYNNVYEMKDNALFMNKIWSAEEVKKAITKYFYPNVKDISYNPANLTIKGLPFIEAGDVIKVYADYNSSFKTFVFKRTLSGEQLLVDKIEAKGIERNEKSDEWIAVAGEPVKE